MADVDEPAFFRIHTHDVDGNCVETVQPIYRPDSREAGMMTAYCFTTSQGLDYHDEVWPLTAEDGSELLEEEVDDEIAEDEEADFGWDVDDDGSFGLDP